MSGLHKIMAMAIPDSGSPLSNCLREWLSDPEKKIFILIDNFGSHISSTMKRHLHEQFYNKDSHDDFSGRGRRYDSSHKSTATAARDTSYGRLLNILQLAPGSTQEEIKRAYKRTAVKLHPDKHPEDRERFGRETQELNELYQKYVSDSRSTGLRP
jgi:hypothetical protein